MNTQQWPMAVLLCRHHRRHCRLLHFHTTIIGIIYHRTNVLVFVLFMYVPTRLNASSVVVFSLRFSLPFLPSFALCLVVLGLIRV